MPKVTGKAPSARSYHSAVAIGNSIGACLLIIKTGLPIIADIFDGFLFFVSMWCRPGAVIFGGNDKNSVFGDVFLLKCDRSIVDSTQGPSLATSEKWSWEEPICVGSKPDARTGHGAAVISSREVT